MILVIQWTVFEFFVKQIIKNFIHYYFVDSKQMTRKIFKYHSLVTWIITAMYKIDTHIYNIYLCASICGGILEGT